MFLYLYPILALLVLDIIWISVYMKNQYQQLILEIQGKKLKFNIYSAVIAYMLMVLIFIQIIAKYKISLLDSFLLGICVYGVYDFTCGSIFQKWDFQLAIIDTLWGGFLFLAINYIHQHY